MFGGQYCEGSLVGPLDHRHWALAVCVHIPFIVLRCCRHVLSVAHNGTGEGGIYSCPAVQLPALDSYRNDQYKDRSPSLSTDPLGYKQH